MILAVNQPLQAQLAPPRSLQIGSGSQILGQYSSSKFNVFYHVYEATKKKSPTETSAVQKLTFLIYILQVISRVTLP